MDLMELYRLSQDRFDAVLAAVPADRWESPSACVEWTVRDVAGHVVWAQYQMRAWAVDEEYAQRAGAPGAPNPGVMAGGDPVAAWREARAACEPTLTEEALARVRTLPGLGEVPLAAVVSLLVTDTTAHAWDIGHPLGIDPRLDLALVAHAFDWGRAHIVRRPGFFGPELTPPGDAGEQTRMLAFLGRAAWEPVGAPS